MSDIKNIEDNKLPKNPAESAINKIKESVTSDLNKKILDKVKEIRHAQKIIITLKTEFKELIKESEMEKIELNDLLKELK